MSRLLSLRSVGLLSVTAALFLSAISCSPSAEDGDEIVRVGRQNNSGTYVYFREAILGKDREFKLGSLDQSGSKDVVSLIERTPNAIGYSGMAYASAGVKMLKVSKKKGEAGAPPVAENVQNGSYPIARPLFLFTSKTPEGPVKAYIDWILSDEGQKIVAEIGYIPVKSSGPAVSTPGEEKVAINVTGSDTMVNLAQAWAQAYTAKHPNVSIQVAGGGSGVGIAGLIDGTVDIANASRQMKPAEIARATQKNEVAPTEFIVGKDALAVYVHKSCSLDSISLEELAEIYGEDGTIEKWSQLTK